jgi:hypothetical protein
MASDELRAASEAAAAMAHAMAVSEASVFMSDVSFL